MSHVREQKTIDYEMSTVDIVHVPDVGNIHNSMAQIVAILGDCPYNHADTNKYGH